MYENHGSNDLEKQRNSDVKGLGNVMVFGNKSNNDITCIDKDIIQSNLQRVRIAGSIKIFKFLQTLMNKN